MNNVKRFLALMMTLAVVLSFSGCLKYTGNILEVTRINQNIVNGNAQNVLPTGGNSQYNPYYDPSNQYQNNPMNQQPQYPTTPVNPQYPTNPVTPGDTSAPVINSVDSENNDNSDPSSWSKKDIVKFTADAVNKTKAYMSPIKVNHKEHLKCDVTKCEVQKKESNTIKKIANGIIEKVVKPTDEIMSFTNGKTVNSDKETVPLLLPKRTSFTLNESGVAKASARKNGPNIVIHIQLISEEGTLDKHPEYNASSVGYLDAGDVDLGPVSLDYLNITYTGTTLDVTVNPEGYVVSALYKIPILIDVKGKALGMTALVNCSGMQSEDWYLKW